MSTVNANERRSDRVDVDAQIGRRVHGLMWDRRITQKTMGERLGIDQSGLGRRLRGDRGWSAAELLAVSEELGVSVGYLFGEDTPTGPERPVNDVKQVDSGVVTDMFEWASTRGEIAS